MTPTEWILNRARELEDQRSCPKVGVVVKLTDESSVRDAVAQLHTIAECIGQAADEYAAMKEV